MSTPIRIDFVSDVACPWCVIGLRSLDFALKNMADEVKVDLHFQPFELNPHMGPDGQDITEHITQKYGISVAQAQANRENIRLRGAELGFVFTKADEGSGGRNRAYNTFDVHRLLHWAGGLGAGAQKQMKEAFFAAYFTDGKNLSNHQELLAIISSLGLDSKRSEAILSSDEFVKEVRAQQQYYQHSGINSVPAIIINNRHLISGGQPSTVFEGAIRKIIAEEFKS